MNDWTQSRFDSLFEVIGGGTPKTTNPSYWGGDIPWLSVGDFAGPQRYVSSTEKSITDLGLEQSSTRLLSAGDLILSARGTVGEFAQVQSPMAFNQSCYGLRARADFLDANFAYYALSEAIHQLRRIAHGSVFSTITRSSLSSLTLRIPNLSSQRDIAEVLGALDDKIAINAKLARNFEVLGAAKFGQLGLDMDPTDHGLTLDTLFEINPRRSIATDSPTVIDMQALPTAEPLVAAWSTGSRKGGTRFMNGDTLLARITPCLENRKTAFVDFLSDGEVGIGSTEFIVIRSKAGLPLGLSYFMATSDRFRDFAIQNMVGTSGRQRVAAADLARHTVSQVEDSALWEFGTWADSTLELLGSIRSENMTLSKIRDALLPQLVSGKLQVKEAEKRVSAVV